VSKFSSLHHGLLKGEFISSACSVVTHWCAVPVSHPAAEYPKRFPGRSRRYGAPVLLMPVRRANPPRSKSWSIRVWFLTTKIGAYGTGF
jgi:hypothetical protein